MNKQQLQVLEFHTKFGATVGDSPAIRNLELRKSLIEEEFQEFVEAYEQRNLVGMIDAMIDLKYVIDGTFIAFGIDNEPFFDEVHRTNMLKVNGSTRDDGKILKPEGWKEPRIKEMLDEMIGRVA